MILGVVKDQISLNFGYHVNFKDFYAKICVCSHEMKDTKHIRRDFFFCLGHAPGVGLSGTGGA